MEVGYGRQIHPRTEQKIISHLKVCRELVHLLHLLPIILAQSV